MANKSVAYMLVAVLIGVTLITAVPDQIARYATPQQMLSIESGDGGERALPKGDSVELYLDSTNLSDANSTEDHEVWFEVVNGTGYSGPWNGTVEVEGLEFSVNISEELGEGVNDLSKDVADLADQLESVSGEFEIAQSGIADVESVAADAVAAAEAASEAVTAVAATANTASEAASDAAEAARGARSAQSTLNMFMWYAFDALIAVGVYFLAKRRFG